MSELARQLPQKGNDGMDERLDLDEHQYLHFSLLGKYMG